MINNDSAETELRGAVRFPLRLPIAVKAAGEEMTAETQNISAGGVLFELSADMAIGSSIEFKISMPAAILGAATDVLVSGAGRVVRCSGDGGRKSVAAVIDEYRFERL